MIVRSVTIKNIRSFREEVTINPHPDMNVLIGSNGSDTEGTGHFVSLGNASHWKKYYRRKLRMTVGLGTCTLWFKVNG